VNGIHDMGGMHGFGRVQREENEPVFPRAMGRARARDQPRLQRAAVFTSTRAVTPSSGLEPVDYLRSSYYERWLDRNIRLLVEKGVITP